MPSKTTIEGADTARTSHERAEVLYIDKLLQQYAGGRLRLSQNVEYLGQTIANEGYAGLERIARQFGVPVGLLATTAAVLGLAPQDGTKAREQ